MSKQVYTPWHQVDELAVTGQSDRRLAWHHQGRDSEGHVGLGVDYRGVIVLVGLLPGEPN